MLIIGLTYSNHFCIRVRRDVYTIERTFGFISILVWEFRPMNCNKIILNTNTKICRKQIKQLWLSYKRKIENSKKTDTLKSKYCTQEIE